MKAIKFIRLIPYVILISLCTFIVLQAKGLCQYAYAAEAKTPAQSANIFSLLGNNASTTANIADGNFEGDNQNEVIKKESIAISFNSLDFRLLDQQLSFVLIDATNQALHSSQISEEDKLSIKNGVPFFEQPVILNYQEESYLTGCMVKVSLAIAEPFKEKYDLVSESIDVAVVPATILPHSALLTDVGQLHGQWFTSSPEVYSEGYLCSFSLEDGYSKRLALQQYEGMHYINTIFLKNDQSSIISIVQNIEYGIDCTKPQINSVVVDSSFTGLGPVMMSQQSITCKVYFSDVVPLFPESSMYIPTSSGINVQDVSFSCFDDYAEEYLYASTVSLINGSNGGCVQITFNNNQNIQISSCIISIKDKAGNSLRTSLNECPFLPSQIERIVVDTYQPGISLTYDNNNAESGNFYKASRSATLLISEPNFYLIKEYASTKTIATINHAGTTIYVTPQNCIQESKDIWSFTFLFEKDGSSTITAGFTDLVGHASPVISDSFVLDTAAPTMQVTFENNNFVLEGYYNQKQLAHIVFIEENFDASLVAIKTECKKGTFSITSDPVVSSWETKDNIHSCFIEFPGNGVYSFTVTGKDMAGNSSGLFVQPAFTIDLESPSIDIVINGATAVDNSAFPETATVDVVITDAYVNPMSQSSINPIGSLSTSSPFSSDIKSNVSEVVYHYTNPPIVRENDNVYQVAVQAEDLAGNKTAKTVRFSLNRFGSVFQLSEQSLALIRKKSITSKELQDITLSEINPTGIDVTQSFITLSIDNRVKTLQLGADYKMQTVNHSGVYEYEYQIFRDNFLKDAVYQLSLCSYDNAGNSTLSSNQANDEPIKNAEVVFAVDNTPPLITFSQLASTYSSDDEVTIEVSVYDNQTIQQTHFYLGESQLTPQLLAANGASHKYAIHIPRAYVNSALYVQAQDEAGNFVKQSPSSLISLRAANPWYCQPPYIAAGIAILFLFSLFLLRLNYKKHD